jgi:hypothetical protein
VIAALDRHGYHARIAERLLDRVEPARAVEASLVLGALTVERVGLPDPDRLDVLAAHQRSPLPLGMSMPGANLRDSKGCQRLMIARQTGGARAALLRGDWASRPS